MIDLEQAGEQAGPALWGAWMARAQGGDQRAYAQLLTALVPVIRRLAQRQISDELLVEDVVQETLLAVHRVRHTYDPGRPFLPWLQAIASARAIDALRSRGRRQRWEVSDEEAVLAQHDASAELRFEQLSAQQQVDGLLGSLPARQRSIVELVYLREMSLADAASTSRLTLAAVKSLLHRAISTLRKQERSGHGRSSAAD